ncbi:hypothetical protein MMC18_007738 [Xylographa bjoerkii]|nr:hypothetical protein [Xylographa bjoerkii]
MNAKTINQDYSLHIQKTAYTFGEVSIENPNSWLVPGSDEFRNLEPSVLQALTRIRLKIRFTNEYPSSESLDTLFHFILENCTPPRLTLECIVHEFKPAYADVLNESFHLLSGLKSCLVEFDNHPTTPWNPLARELAYEATKPSGSTVSSSSFPLMRLPKELRYQIFSQTDLVATKPTYPWADGFIISSTKSNQPCIRHFRRRCCGTCNPKHARDGCYCLYSKAAFSTSCTCFSFPAALFTVSQQVSLEAHEVFFSENRFILFGLPTWKLAFLQCHPLDMLQRIRRLDLFFTATEITCWTRDVNLSIRREWEQLIEFIAHNLNLSNLTLSIDAGAVYDSYQECGLSRLEFENYVEVCRAFAKPLPQLKGLARFQVFLACAFDLESEIEKEVMGEHYVSTACGKVTYTMRDHRNPHRQLPGEQRKGMRLIEPSKSEDDDSDSGEDEDSDEDSDEDEQVDENDEQEATRDMDSFVD